MPERRAAHPGRGNRLRSLNHVLGILEVLHTYGPDLGVTELARKVGMAKSAVHEVLVNLEARSYVTRSGSGRYALGMKLAELGVAVQHQRGIIEAAAPHLDALASLSGESTHLSVYDDGGVVYLDKVTTPHAVQAYTTVGARAPAHCVAHPLTEKPAPPGPPGRRGRSDRSDGHVSWSARSGGSTATGAWSATTSRFPSTTRRCCSGPPL